MMNMADDETKLPERYKVLKSGAVYDREAGRIVSHSGEGQFQITSANARAMVAKKREKAIAAQMRGLAAKNGIALPEDATDEQILKGALDGVEALTAHMKDVFLKSNNIRGLAEAYSKLVTPLVGQQPEEDEQVVDGEWRVLIREIAIAARKLDKQSADVIDADAE
jgi:hypothetical protein